MKSNTFVGNIKMFGLIGLVIGIFLFILAQVIEIPVVIGTTSYEGMTAAILLLIGSLVLLIVLGIIVSVFKSSIGKK